MKKKNKKYPFTPLRCKACNSIIEDDIHDVFCEKCSGAKEEDALFDEEDYYILEEYRHQIQ